MRHVSKTAVFLLAAVISLSLCACGNANVPDTGKTTKKPDNGQDENTVECAPTEAVVAGSNVFAQSNKAWYADSSYLCGWWLRFPGMYKDTYVSYVNHSGSVTAGGQVYLSGTDICVRPAIWISVD